MENDHPLLDISREAEAIKNEHTFVIYVIEQIVLEVVPGGTWDVFSDPYIELRFGKVFR